MQCVRLAESGLPSCGGLREQPSFLTLALTSFCSSRWALAELPSLSLYRSTFEITLQTLTAFLYLQSLNLEQNTVPRA